MIVSGPYSTKNIFGDFFSIINNKAMSAIFTDDS